jgi:hypothetical protein
MSSTSPTAAQPETPGRARRERTRDQPLSAAAIHVQAAFDPSIALEAVQRSLADELESTEMSLSLCYAVIDSRAGELRFANAGHPHAFRVGSDGDCARLAAIAPPIGFSDASIEECVMAWRPGDRLVLFTDGQDSSSLSDPDALFDVARRTTATVDIVLASNAPERSSASPFARSPGQPPITIGRMYDQLARETGGMVVPTTLGDNLASTFRRTLADFRASYVLYFTPEGVARSGSHTIDVRVTRDGTDVRARRGYVWK